MRRTVLHLLALAVLAVAPVGCDCGRTGIAELTQTAGTVERDDAPMGETWYAAQLGDRLDWDEAVRTGADARAVLRVGGANQISLEPNTIVRLRRQGTSEQSGLHVESGEVQLESGESLTLVTRAGAVELEGGTRLRFRAGGTERLEIMAGRATIEGGNELQVGRAVLLSAGGVEFEASPEDVQALSDAGVVRLADAGIDAGNDAGSDAPNPFAGNPDEVENLEREGTLEPSPDRAHLEIDAGDTVTIHDTSAPTAVRVRLPGNCTGPSFVSLSNGIRYQGTGTVNILVPGGRVRYTVRCGSGANAAGGSISVRRDDGSLRLESVAPRNVCDADGRTYDLLYQNALPVVSFRWASASGPHSVEVTTAGRSRTVSGTGASHVFESGQLRDGDHSLVFVSGTRRSSPTRVRIRFDNAAPTAHIREPRGAISRGAVHVSGMAIEGAVVSADGQGLPLDGDNRFEGDVTVPADLDALAIRFAHPRSGVHYYLRRVQ